MNHCDHNHETSGEIRRLPTGGDAAVLVCRRHFDAEIAHRVERSKQTGRDKWDFPAWDELSVDQFAVRPCLRCGADTGGSDRWVWFGLHGPFCSVACRDKAIES